MTTPHALQTLAQILTAAEPAAYTRFLDAVGDLRVRPSHLRCPYPIKALLVRWSNLRPHVREALAADLEQRWQAFAATDPVEVPPPVTTAATEALPAVNSAPVNNTRVKLRVSAPPGTARREDAFDRLLGWLACLLGR